MNARKAVIPMLKRALISALIILPILAFIDWASSPLVQSCLAEGTVGTEPQDEGVGSNSNWSDPICFMESIG